MCCLGGALRWYGVYYSEDLIEEIRLKNDIVDVISGYVRLRKQGGRYFG